MVANCDCGHDKSEHNKIGCGFTKCSCTRFREKVTTPETDADVDLEAVGKVEIDEDKLIETFKAWTQKGKQNPKDKKKNIVTKANKWDIDEKFETRITELGKDYEEQLKEAENWLKESFENIDAWIQKGRAEYYLDKSKNALQTFDTALLLCNRNTNKNDRVIETKLKQIYKLKAWTWEDLNEYTESIKCYEAALKITPDDILFVNAIAWDYIQLNEYEKAQSYLERVLKIEHDNIMAVDNMGYCYLQLKNYNMASEYFQRSNKSEKSEGDHFALEKTTEAYWLLDDDDNTLKYANQLIEKGSADGYIHYLKGRILGKQKKYDDAIISFHKALSYNKPNADLFFSLGLCYQNKEDHARFDLAILYYERALKLDSREAGRDKGITCSNLAICYGAIKDYENALSRFDDALRNDPKNSRAFLGKLETYDSLEKWDEIIVACDERPEFENDEEYGKACLGYQRDALTSLLKFDEALVCSKKLLEKGENANSYSWHGWILDKLGCIDESMKYFDLAIKIEPDDEEGYRMKGDSLYEQKKYQDSLEFLQKGWELGSVYCFLKKGMAIKNIGSKEKSKEKQKEAIAIFDEIIKNKEKVINEYLTRAWGEKGNCYWNLQDYDTAEKCYLAATELDPGSVDALLCLGDCARKRDSNGESLIFYDKALLYDEENIEIYLGKSRALEELKQFSECIECCDEVLKLDESNIEAWFLKGICFGRMEKYQIAIDHFKEFIEKYPNVKTKKGFISAASAWGNIALSQIKSKKYQEALDSCEEAIKIENKFVGAFEHKVDALKGLNRIPDAIICLEKILNLPNCNMKYTLQELIKLNRRMGDDDKAKEYEKKLKELNVGT